VAETVAVEGAVMGRVEREAVMEAVAAALVLGSIEVSVLARENL
jgi:hypothetical protein